MGRFTRPCFNGNSGRNSWATDAGSAPAANAAGRYGLWFLGGREIICGYPAHAGISLTARDGRRKGEGMTPQNWHGTVVRVGYSDAPTAEPLKLAGASGPVHDGPPPEPEPERPMTYTLPPSSPARKVFEALRVMPVPRRRRFRVKRALMWVGVVVTICGAFAPHAIHQAIPASAVHPISGTVCSNDGGVSSATVEDNAGPYSIARVVCGDHVTERVALDK